MPQVKDSPKSYDVMVVGSERSMRDSPHQGGAQHRQPGESPNAPSGDMKHEMAKAGAGGVAAAMPKTLAMLLAEFITQHVQENLAPKTVERYFEMATYVAPELLTRRIIPYCFF